LQLDSSFTPALVHLIDGELYDNPDRTEFRRLHALLARGDASAEVAPYQYWARVLGLGDTAAVRALHASMDTASTGMVSWLTYYPLFGIGELRDIERAVEILHRRTAADPAVESGRLWRNLHSGLVSLGRPTATRALLERAIDGAASPVPWLIHAVDEALHAEGDSAFAAVAANRLELLTRGDTTAAAGLPLCALGRWRAWSGERVDVIADGLTRLGEGNVVCANLIRTIRAVVTDAPDAAAQLARLDSEVRVGPSIGEVQLMRVNISLARLHEASGDPAGALRAIRRRPSSANSDLWYVPALEFEGRMAAAIGDRDAAIRVFTRWLELRASAEPMLQPRIERVRAELARLTAEG
ncbi:MAG TPA: hypothetical protein VMO26_17945, partial [Vicinamibacterales bacterium]|nr:hypothetical protein [Vicinamibacterales bacterium]